MQTLLGFVLAMSITMLLIPLLMRLAAPLGFIDMPSDRKVHTTPVPRIGGIAMFVGIVVPLLLWDASSPTLQAVLCSVGILLGFGVLDDRHALGSGAKFAGQALATVLTMFWGGVNVVSLALTDRTVLPVWISVPLTFLFLIGGTNAFNLADGLDGLAGGMTILCLSGTALLAFTVGITAVGSAAVVMVGALVGFLRFNTHPARIFMGDAGSQGLGFSAAVLAILLTQNPQVPLSTALPLLLLGMPIIDTLMVMIERLLDRKSPFVADRRHIHHRLLALGFEHWEAVSILYLLQCALFVAAWFLRFDSDVPVATVFLLFAGAVLVPIHFAQRAGLRIRRSVARTSSGGAPALPPGAEVLVRTTAIGLIAGILAIYGAWVLICADRPSADVGMLGIAVGAVLLTGLLVRWKQSDASWTDKIGLFASAALAVYLNRQVFPQALLPPLVECILFPVLAVAVAVCIYTAKDRPFRITPLDVLVLLLVITVPNLPGSVVNVRSIGLAVAELVLLLYAFEALSHASRRHWRRLSGGAAAFLLGLAARAMW